MRDGVAEPLPSPIPPAMTSAPVDEDIEAVALFINISTDDATLNCDVEILARCIPFVVIATVFVPDKYMPSFAELKAYDGRDAVPFGALKTFDELNCTYPGYI